MSIDDVIEAGERLPGMAALWHVATVEDRREMVMLILEPGGLHYDVETHEIAAITPRPVFLPVLRLLAGVTEYEEATGTLVTRRWQQRNRVLGAYVHYFNHARPHQGIKQQIPEQKAGSALPDLEGGKVLSLPILGGLHHDYRRSA